MPQRSDSYEIGRLGLTSGQGRRVDLFVHIEPFESDAIVRYRQGLRYGFEFLTVTDYQRDMIRRVCEILASKS